MSFLNVDSHNDHKSQQNIDKTKHHHANYSFKDYLNIEGIFFKSVEQFFLSDMCMDRPFAVLDTPCLHNAHPAALIFDALPNGMLNCDERASFFHSSLMSSGFR